MKTSDTNWKEVAALIALSLVILVLWNSLILYPLRLLVVFFHEISHATAALLTGGGVYEIRLNPAEGGLAMTRGGNGFLILSAGYLGSLLIGGMILLVTARTQWRNGLVGTLGAVLALVTLMWVRPLIGFGFLYGASASAALIACAYLLPRWANEYLLKVVGLTSCLYAIYDIQSDVISRPGARSDAAMLAEATGIPTLIWGLFWIAIALCASAFFVRLACKKAPAHRA